jgi:hypothetical protein
MIKISVKKSKRQIFEMVGVHYSWLVLTVFLNDAGYLL